MQPRSNHLLVATPFLRMRISYSRIRRATSASMAMLFPPKSLRGLRREILNPLFNMTAVVVELNALPIPASTLRLFLSPFFFKDNTPHLVILVQDWMSFSTQLESLRVSGSEPVRSRTIRRGVRGPGGRAVSRGSSASTVPRPTKTASTRPRRS